MLFRSESITYWDFVDGGWLGAPAGLLRRDGSAKPAYEELYKLIRNEWWTAEKTYVTDENGSINVSGFLGDYEISARGGTIGSFRLSRGGREVKITVKNG